MKEGDLVKSSALKWYIVVTKSRCERIARENLELQGYKVILPRISIRRRHRGVWKNVHEPMFPGYLFVSLTLGEDDPAPIRSTVGCVGIVRFGLKLQAVPHNVISPFLEIGDTPVEYRESLDKGDKVLFEEGPFVGLEAICTMSSGSDRVEVLLSLLGREITVAAELNQLTKLN